ncbi:MAG: hypothetical protein AAGA30_16915, partial [Planctomycetota bacterium]
MRVLMLGIVVAIAAIMPASTNADDQQIADFIKARLMQEKQQGNLFGFNVDMRVDQGTVWFKGFVSNRDQELMILRTAQLAGHLGVVQVVDDIDVSSPYGQAQAQVQAQGQAAVAPTNIPGQTVTMPQQRVAMNQAYTGTIAPRAMAPQQSSMPQQQMVPAPPQGNMSRPLMPMTRPTTPAPKMPLPAATTSQRMPMPLSKLDEPKQDENTKRVAYQEPIATPYTTPNYSNPGLNSVVVPN